MERILECFEEKPKPTNSEQLLKLNLITGNLEVRKKLKLNDIGLIN